MARKGRAGLIIFIIILFLLIFGALVMVFNIGELEILLIDL